MQSRAGNISGQWVISSSATLVVAPTRWSNCSCNTNFQASRQGHVSGDITWPARSPDLAFLCGYVKSKVYETRHASIDYLKHLVLECIQGIPKEILQSVTTDFHRDCRSVLNEMVVTYSHIETVMIKMDSHWHGMRPIVLIKFVPLSLRSYFI